MSTSTPTSYYLHSALVRAKCTHACATADRWHFATCAATDSKQFNVTPPYLRLVRLAPCLGEAADSEACKTLATAGVAQRLMSHAASKQGAAAKSSCSSQTRLRARTSRLPGKGAGSEPREAAAAADAAAQRLTASKQGAAVTAPYTLAYRINPQHLAAHQ